MRIETRVDRFSNDVYLHEFYTFIPENEAEVEILKRIIASCGNGGVGLWLYKQGQKGQQGGSGPEFVALSGSYFGSGRWPGFAKSGHGPHLGQY